MAGLLFVDGVSFSRLNDNTQIQIAGGFYKQCRRELKSIEARLGRGAKLRLIKASTGDGVLICLDETTRSKNPGLILLDVAFKLQNWARRTNVHFRMGLHRGTFNRVRDVNRQANVIGSDVNMAQRVMAFGDEDHILCSDAAWRAFFQEGAKSLGQVAFDDLPGPYKDKKDQTITIINVIRSRNGRVINGNPKPPKVRLNPDMHLFPPAKSLEAFTGVRHLTVVGVTNDQIGQMLGIGLGAPKRRKSQTIKRLDVYYPMNYVYDHLPKHEESLRYPGAVDGNPRRDPKTCKGEKRRSIKILKALGSKDVRVRLLEHPFLPATAIIARDFQDPKRGMIEATHYIWGWKLGSCPTVTWRAYPANQVYDLYRYHLELLEKESKVLYDSLAAR